MTQFQVETGNMKINKDKFSYFNIDGINVYVESDIFSNNNEVVIKLSNLLVHKFLTLEGLHY